MLPGSTGAELHPLGMSTQHSACGWVGEWGWDGTAGLFIFEGQQSRLKYPFFFFLICDTKKEELHKGNGSGNKRERERGECKQSQAISAASDRGGVITVTEAVSLLPEISFENTHRTGSFDSLLSSPR